MSIGKLGLVALLGLIILTAGCIKLDMNFKVNPDGKGTAEMSMDITGLATAGTGLGLPATEPSAENAAQQEKYKKDNICATLKESADQSAGSGTPDVSSFAGGLDVKNARCEGVADYKVKYTWDNVDFTTNGMLTVSDTTFSKKFTFSFKSDNPSETTAPSMVSPTQLKALGLQMNLKVEMPGAVSSASAGTISEDKKSVTVDLVENYEKINSGTPITIVSEETNLMIIGGIILAVIIVLAIGFFLMQKKK